MKRNVFIALANGSLDTMEFAMKTKEDNAVMVAAIEAATHFKGGVLILSAIIEVDALLTLQQMIQSELTCRAEMLLEAKQN